MMRMCDFYGLYADLVADANKAGGKIVVLT